MKRPNTSVPDFMSSLSSVDTAEKIEESDSAAQILLSLSSKRTMKNPLDGDEHDEEMRSQPSKKKRRTDQKKSRPDIVPSTGALVSDDEDELPLKSCRMSRQRNNVVSSSSLPPIKKVNQVALSKPVLCTSNWRAISRPLPPPPRLPRLGTGVIFQRRR